MKEQDMSKAGTVSSYWIEIGDENALVKTKQALREKTATRSIHHLYQRLHQKREFR